MPDLFSYGTLQQTDVQLSTFGRRLSGQADALHGWVESVVEITDPGVVATSGKTHHPILIPGEGLPVCGTVFTLTDAELARADAYEVADYARSHLRLASGRYAWVYVGAANATERPAPR